MPKILKLSKNRDRDLWMLIGLLLVVGVMAMTMSCAGGKAGTASPSPAVVASPSATFLRVPSTVVTMTRPPITNTKPSSIPIDTGIPSPIPATADDDEDAPACFKTPDGCNWCCPGPRPGQYVCTTIQCQP